MEASTAKEKVSKGNKIKTGAGQGRGRGGRGRGRKGANAATAEEPEISEPEIPEPEVPEPEVREPEVPEPEQKGQKNGGEEEVGKPEPTPKAKSRAKKDATSVEKPNKEWLAKAGLAYHICNSECLLLQAQELKDGGVPIPDGFEGKAKSYSLSADMYSAKPDTGSIGVLLLGTMSVQSSLQFPYPIPAQVDPQQLLRQCGEEPCWCQSQRQGRLQYIQGQNGFLAESLPRSKASCWMGGVLASFMAGKHSF